MFWEFFRWTPGGLAFAFLVIGAASRARAEPLVILALLAIQAVVLVLPIVSHWVGEKVGERRSGPAE